jgi:hypothetical protein
MESGMPKQTVRMTKLIPTFTRLNGRCPIRDSEIYDGPYKQAIAGNGRVAPKPWRMDFSRLSDAFLRPVAGGLRRCGWRRTGEASVRHAIVTILPDGQIKPPLFLFQVISRRWYLHFIRHPQKNALFVEERLVKCW